MSLTTIWATLIFILIAICGESGLSIARMIISDREKKKLKSEKEDELKDHKERLEYSKDVLEFIKFFAGQIIVLRFQEFQDGHRIERITKERFKNTVKTITEEVNRSIDMSKIDFNRLLYDKEFIEKYIIQVCITMLKKMLNEALIDIDE